MPKVRLASVAEIPEGGMTMREHDGLTVMLTKIDGKIYAMNDTCTHSGAPLHMGVLGAAGSPYLLTCPWHAAHFDVSTGKVYQDTPWATDTEVYPVEINGDDVFVDLE
jgi:3-phenylpropionate/trans-cinnamate dioxygenase ferredoxin component